MNAVDAAFAYLKEGFAPVPIPLGSKAPRLPGWQDLVVTEDQVEGLFRDGNIGLLLGARSGGLVDVDLDAPAAVELAPDFLPATDRIHGRASKPRSHWWYRVASPPTTKQFKGCRGESLVELRGNGAQTLVPPSVHPSDELTVWAASGDPTEISAEALLLAVQRLAAATLMVSHYPAEGSRQDFAMALSGLLLQGGWPESETIHFVECVARVARDEEIASRSDAAQRTASSLRDGKGVTGGGKLAELIGADVCRRLSRWLGLSASPGPRALSQPGGGPGRADPKSLEQLLDLTSGLELFHTPEDEAFVIVPTPVGAETLPIDSQAFTNWVFRSAREHLKLVPREQLLKELAYQLAAEAKHNRPSHKIYIRVAGTSERLFIDLADAARTVIEVTPDGWQRITGCSIRFFRPNGMQALPMPQSPSDPTQFKTLFNTASDDDTKLLLAWTLFALFPAGPYPLLILQGEAGSAKSTLAHMVRRIVDPSSLPLRSFPRDERDFVIAARTNHVLCFDNLSGINDRDSDLLCRIASGTGFATRRLFTNFDEVRFQICRPVILNGIDDLATRSDLIDRTIVLTLPSISPGRRITEATLWRNFDAALPSLFGRMLDVLVAAMQCRPLVELREKPRMADFALFGAAAELALGWDEGGFMRAFNANQHAALEVGIEGSIVAQAICAFQVRVTEWEGTATELLERLNAVASDRSRNAKNWPPDASKLGNQLRRVAAALRVRGIEIEWFKAPNSKRTRLIRIRQSSAG